MYPATHTQPHKRQQMSSVATNTQSVSHNVLRTNMSSGAASYLFREGTCTETDETFNIMYRIANCR